MLKNLLKTSSRTNFSAARPRSVVADKERAFCVMRKTMMCMLVNVAK